MGEKIITGLIFLCGAILIGIMIYLIASVEVLDKRRCLKRICSTSLIWNGKIMVPIMVCSCAEYEKVPQNTPKSDENGHF